MAQEQSFVQTFSRRYKIALAITVCMISFIFLFALFNNSNSKNYAAVINKAGEQRMLSQRLALLAQPIIDNKTVTQHHRDSLQASVKKFLDNHSYVQSESERLKPYTLLQIKSQFAGPTGLNMVVPKYAQLVLQLAGQEDSDWQLLSELQQIDIELLINDLDSVVKLLEEASINESQQSNSLIYLIWFLTLSSILAFERLFFKPTENRLVKTYNELDSERERVNKYNEALNTHSIVLKVDSKAMVLEHNSKFGELYGYQTNEIVGKPIDLLQSIYHNNEEFQTLKVAIERGTYWHGDVCGKAKSQRCRWFTTTVVPFKHNDTSGGLSIVIQNDITEQKLTTIALQRIHDVTSQSELSINDKVTQLIKIGCDIFNLPYGVLVQEGSGLRIFSCESPQGELTPGEVFPKQEEVFSDLLLSQNPIALSNLKDTVLFGQFEIDAYLGGPITIGDEPFGTLCFFSVAGSDMVFNRFDHELLQLISTWITNEIARSNQTNRLAAQTQLMDQMSEQAHIGAWEVDFTTNTLFWSEMTKAIHEVPLDYQPDINTAINFYKEGFSRKRITELIQASMKTGDSYREELQLVTATGREIWVEAYGQCELKEGVCVRMYGSFQDITTRVEAQTVIEQAKSRLEFVLQATAVGIWDWTIETGEAVFNERWADIVGYSLKELEPISVQTWMSLAHDDDLKKSEQELQRHWSGESEYYTCESRMKHKDGHWVWVLDTGKVVEWHMDGTPKRMIGTHIDISKLKSAEYEIKESNQRVRLAADSAEIGIFDYDMKRQVINWDDWMHRLYGLELGSFGGQFQDWFIHVHPEDQERVAKEFQAALDNKSVFVSQFRVFTADKTLRHIKASAFLKQNEDGVVINVVGVNYDVTERVLHEHALLDAKTKAEAAVKTKNEFLASMSHEIRTPMNGVIGMLDLVQETQLDKDQAHYVNIAKSSANALLVLINDILDFSKIDANKLELERIPFDLPLLINEITESFALRAENKGLELVIDTVDVNTQFVMGDPSRIRQILMNLIGNAIKFTHQGEIVVSAQLSPQENNKWQLRLSVADTGIGIEFNKQQQVFELFSQVDSSTTRHYGGTGLGLAIVKKLCVLMNGDIELISSPKVGSEFICTLELEETEQLSPLQSDISIENLKVLVVDDNQTNRDILQRQLTMWGAIVTLSSGADEAWQLCLEADKNNQQFDVAIIDMQMPAISGDELAKRLKAEPSFTNIKLIMMTSMQMRGDAEYFAKIGFIGYFPKPVSRNDLQYALKIIIEDGELIRKAKPILNTPFVSEVRRLSKDVVRTEHQIKSTKLLRVLLVEDNKVNQIVAQGIITKLGHTLALSENGREAIERLSEESVPYDVVLMDIQMPEMDGFDATRAIRQGVAGAVHQSTTIIAMTANAMQGDKEKCLEAGMDEYISKPISLDALKDKLAQFFG